MTTSIIHLAVGLVLLVAVNIVLGSLNALFDGSFDKVKLRNGTIKGIIVAACFIAFYMAGWLNPDIIAIDVGRADRELDDCLQPGAAHGLCALCQRCICEIEKPNLEQDLRHTAGGACRRTGNC